MRTNYKRLKNIVAKNFNYETCEARFKGFVLISDEGLETEQRVRIELTDFHSKYKNEVGIHLKLSKSIEHDLVNAIEDAFKDSFPVIYVYQAPKPSAERRERLIKSVRSWIDAITKRESSWLYGSSTLNAVFTPIEDTLETMSEDQLEATLKLMSACYQKAGQEGRDFRKSMDQRKEQTA